MLMIPLRSNEFDDRVLGLLQSVARFLDHQLMNLRHVGGGQMALFLTTVLGRADHSSERGFHIQQGAGDIHQHRIAWLTMAERQRVDHIDLVEDDFAWLAEAKDRQGVGNLLERSQQRVQLDDLLPVATNEQIEAVLDPHQLFAKRSNHRTHGVAVGPGQARALLVNLVVGKQRLVQTILVLQRADARRLRRSLGHIEQQVLQQIVRRRLIDRIGAFVDQAFELLVDLAQQGPDRGAIHHAAGRHAFDQTGSYAPQGPERRLLAQGFQAREYPRHVAQVGPQVLIADHSNQCHLQHLAQLAQQDRQLGSAQGSQALQRERGSFLRHVRFEQTGFGKQFLATRGAQIVQQRQHDHRQVPACRLDSVQVRRQLQNRLHQHFQRFTLVGDPADDQRLSQLLHLFGKQRSAVELDHLQGAEHLMHVGLAETHARRVLGVLDIRFERLARLLQRLGDLTLYPFQGDIVMPITHTDSAHKLFRVNARTSSSATGCRSGCCQPTTSPTPTTSKPPGASRSARRLRISRRRQRRK